MHRHTENCPFCSILVAKISLDNLIKKSSFDRFKDRIGDTWDTPIETGYGDLTKEEEKQIMDGDFYGKEISEETIKLLNEGKSYSRSKGGKFVLRFQAEDGNYVHKHRTKQELINDAKGYPGHRRSNNSWVDDDGRSFESEGATYEEIFGKNSAVVDDVMMTFDNRHRQFMRKIEDWILEKATMEDLESLEKFIELKKENLKKEN